MRDVDLIVDGLPCLASDKCEQGAKQSSEPEPATTSAGAASGDAVAGDEYESDDGLDAMIAHAVAVGEVDVQAQAAGDAAGEAAAGCEASACEDAAAIAADAGEDDTPALTAEQTEGFSFGYPADALPPHRLPRA